MRPNDSALTTEHLIEKPEFFSFFVDLDKIACVYGRERTFEQKQLLAQLYRELTGDNIESRLARLGAKTAKP